MLAIIRDERLDKKMRRDVAGAMRAAEAIPGMLSLLHDEQVDEYVRGHIAEALGEMSAAEAVPGLLLNLQGGERGRAATASVQIWRANGSRFTESLRLALRDEEPLVRLKAAQMLGYFDAEKRTLHELSHMAEAEDDQGVRQAAAIAKEQFARKLVLFDVR